MKLLKFGTILNIVFGVIFFLIMLIIGIFGVLIKVGEFDMLISLAPEEFQQPIREIINEYINAGRASQEIRSFGEQNNIPEFIISLLADNNIIYVLMGVGFSFAGYAIIFHFVGSAFILSRINNPKRFSPLSRILSIFIAIFSVIAFVLPTVIMLFGTLMPNKKELPERRPTRQPAQPEHRRYR